MLFTPTLKRDDEMKSSMNEGKPYIKYHKSVANKLPPEYKEGD